MELFNQLLELQDKIITLANSKAEKKHYEIYIKSHTEAPDYEDDTTAYSKDEAMDYFLKRMGGDWDKKMIEDCVQENN